MTVNSRHAIYLILKAVLVIAFVWIALLLGFGQAHILKSYAGGTAFWKDNEVYLYLTEGHIGYRIEYRRLPGVWVRELFNAVPEWDKIRDDVLVVKIRSSLVEKTYLSFGRGHGPSSLTPFGDNLYALCPGAGLCRWDVDHFQPVGNDRESEFDDKNGLLPNDLDGTVINGWAVKRSERIRPQTTFEFTLGDGSKVTVRNRAKDPDVPWIHVELKRPNQPVELLYDVNSSPRFVTSWTYNRAFR